MSENRILESMPDAERLGRLKETLEAMGYSLDDDGRLHPGRTAVASTASRPGSPSHGSPEASGGPLHRILDDWRAAERRLAHAYDEASRAEVELEVGRLRREYQAESRGHDEGR
jgi:hypothetical protein